MNLPRRKFPYFFWTILIVFFIVFGVLFAKAYNVSSKVFKSRTSFFKRVTNVLIHGGSAQLVGESDDRINILLLGYGGEGHDGTYLTDTIIVASIKPSSHEIVLTSIPRDYLWESGDAKINFAYANAIAKYKDSDKAAQEAMTAVESVTGLTIPYYATIDFKGFEEAINKVGGVDVNVERTFTDSQYPDEAFGYLAPITFNAGQQHMNGTKALQFARSRHGDNGEDSDFARSKRQSLIISAFKAKVESLNLLSNTSKLNGLVDILADHAHTNLDPNEILHLASIAKDDQATINSKSLAVDDSFICQTVDPTLGYIIKPCDGVTDQQVRNFFINSLGDGAVQSEKAEIIMENAGTDDTLFLQTKNELQSMGMTVYVVAYKGLPIQRSVLYQVNDKPATIRYLEKKLGVKAQPKPAQMTAKADLVLIIGGTK